MAAVMYRAAQVEASLIAFAECIQYYKHSTDLENIGERIYRNNLHFTCTLPSTNVWLGWWLSYTLITQFSCWLRRLVLVRHSIANKSVTVRGNGSNARGKSIHLHCILEIEYCSSHSDGLGLNSHWTIQGGHYSIQDIQRALHLNNIKNQHTQKSK